MSKNLPQSAAGTFSPYDRLRGSRRTSQDTDPPSSTTPTCTSNTTARRHGAWRGHRQIGQLQHRPGVGVRAITGEDGLRLLRRHRSPRRSQGRRRRDPCAIIAAAGQPWALPALPSKGAAGPGMPTPLARCRTTPKVKLLGAGRRWGPRPACRQVMASLAAGRMSDLWCPVPTVACADIRPLVRLLGIGPSSLRENGKREQGVRRRWRVRLRLFRRRRPGDATPKAVHQASVNLEAPSGAGRR